MGFALQESIAKLGDQEVLRAAKYLRPALEKFSQDKEVYGSHYSDSSIAMEFFEASKSSGFAKLIYDDISMQEFCIETIFSAKMALLVACQLVELRGAVRSAIEASKLELRNIDSATILGVGAAIYLVARCIPIEIHHKVTSEVDGAKSKNQKDLKIVFPKSDLLGFTKLIDVIKGLGSGS